jgi:hypothetical protein
MPGGDPFSDFPTRLSMLIGSDERADRLGVESLRYPALKPARYIPDLEPHT